MCPKNSRKSILDALQFTIPKLTKSKQGWYIYFYAYHPLEKDFKRKRIRINFRNHTQREKMQMANVVLNKLTEKLMSGWNPWIEEDNSASFNTFDNVVDKFRNRLEKMTEDGLLEQKSLETKLSHLNVIVAFNKTLYTPIKYIYQFDKKFISDFLDYVYEVRRVSARTRDNHLAFVRTFCSYLVEKCFLKNRPDDGIKVFGRKNEKKKRTPLSDTDLKRLIAWCDDNDKHFKLAVYLIFYCCIRPKEMVLLKIRDINLKNQTLFISSDIAKNDKDACVTLPETVIKLMLDLNLFSYPEDHYIFSKKWQPGDKLYKPDKFRDYWTDVIRPNLKFPANYQFYSLKDTGITHMLRNNIDPLSVRDQARHSSISMTNKYTDIKQMQAIDALKAYKDNIIS